MHPFYFVGFLGLLRWGIFAEGRFLGKVLDEWIDDAQEFVHTKLPHLLMAVLIAYVLVRLLRLITNRMIRIAEKHAAGGSRISQVKTLANVISATGLAIIGTITALQFLAAVGVNLTPLLASAGVAGVAVGLAAQSIVKDVLNGIIIVIEDQFDVGDTVRLSGMTGTVEAMTLRKTTVRDGDGTLYIIPNSQITIVANLSRDFSVATINVSVDFSADPDKVQQILVKVATDIRNSDAFKSVFLADPQVLGVDSMKGSQLIFPVIFKTKATQQYGPMREFQRRVRLALEEHHMLPGDPNRVFSSFSEKGNATQQGSAVQEEPHEAPKADPTANKAHDVNPFNPE